MKKPNLRRRKFLKSLALTHLSQINVGLSFLSYTKKSFAQYVPIAVWKNKINFKGLFVSTTYTEVLGAAFGTAQASTIYAEVLGAVTGTARASTIYTEVLSGVTGTARASSVYAEILTAPQGTAQTSAVYAEVVRSLT